MKGGLDMRRIGPSALVLVVMTATIICAGVLTAVAYKGQTTRVSYYSTGEGNGDTGSAAISSDGKHVAYESGASNVVAGDMNAVPDIFMKDLISGGTTRVSSDSIGTQANGSSGRPCVSADGGAVAFESAASNLVAGDPSVGLDVFVKVLASGETTCASRSSSGVFGNGYSQAPSISDDGDLVAFQSAASNLVASDTNGYIDVFVKDLTSGETTRVSTNSSGVQGNGYSYRPSVSADGNHVAFDSEATNLTSVVNTGVASDIFVKDLASGETTRVSTTSSRALANGPSYKPSISADGRYVAFQSDASNLVAGDTNATTDVFVKDLTTGQIARVSAPASGSEADGISSAPSISDDGRYVAFQSDAANLVAGDTNGLIDVFVKDRTTRAITRVSCRSDSLQGDGGSGSPSISGTGQYVVFDSSASNLVTGDTNGRIDIFLNEVEMLPFATVGAPSKPSAVYTWATFKSTGTITAHAGVAAVTIECYRSKTGPPVYRYNAYTTSGGTTYSYPSVRLPSSGYWYLRAKHLDATHRLSYSAWTTVYVSSSVLVTAPKVPTSMTHGHTYSVYGTIKPRHTSSTYIVVNAYRWNGSTYVYKTHFHVRITNSGQPANTTKYIASVKLTTKGYWKLRVKHSAHGVEGTTYSGYSARFKVN